MSGADVVIVPYRDGPYLVRGPVVLRDQTGETVHLSRHPIALCRCGKSQIRPFCDGTHQTIRFHAPSEPEGDPAAGSESGPPAGIPQPHKGSASAQAALVRAQQILTAARQEAEHAHEPTVSAVRAFVVAALQLLQMQRPSSTSTDSAVLFLIRGALETLELRPSPQCADAVLELRQAVEWLREAS